MGGYNWEEKKEALAELEAAAKKGGKKDQKTKHHTKLMSNLVDAQKAEQKANKDWRNRLRVIPQLLFKKSMSLPCPYDNVSVPPLLVSVCTTQSSASFCFV